MLLGQQGDYTKFPYILCEWDSRNRIKHWAVKHWPKWKNLEPGTINTIRDNLVEPQTILLPPLYIKLVIMIKFVKTHDKNVVYFQYLCNNFSILSEAKLREDIFDEPLIRNLMNDIRIQNNMTNVEKQAWKSF